MEEKGGRVFRGITFLELQHVLPRMKDFERMYRRFFKKMTASH